MFSGVDRQLQVRPPRLEAEVEIDGVLDEPAWQQAARLTGFSRYAPVDGGAADRATEVLVWYSPSALHFGVRASGRGRHGVQATLADRDRIDADDHVQFFLSTFDDGRQAFVFAVNPFGVQMDGAMVEGVRVGRRRVRRTRAGPRGRRPQPRLRVPVARPPRRRRLRGRGAHPVQEPALPVGGRAVVGPARHAREPAGRRGGELGAGAPRRRVVPRAGRRARRACTTCGAAWCSTSIPWPRPASNGAPDRRRRRWDYDGSRPDLGGNVRWGVTQTLTLNGTVNPDFSQVEADAGQFQFDPRQALFFPEKRPFFLDGIEQFATPNNLIYTRRIVAPLAAAKLTGRVSRGTSVAYLSAVDDAATSATGNDHPVFNLLRAQRDIGAGSKVALVYTDRIDGPRSNRVAGADTRLVWKDVYSLLLQGAASRTDTGDAHDRRAALAGHLQPHRPALRPARPVARHRPRLRDAVGLHQPPRRASRIYVDQPAHDLRPPGRGRRALHERRGRRRHLAVRRLHGRPASQDRKLHFNQNLALRGGWRVGRLGAGRDVRLRRVALPRLRGGARPPPGGGVPFVPYTGTPRLPNLDYVLSFTVPTRKGSPPTG